MVEATALLELARLFNSMGLKDGASSKAEEGIGRVDLVGRSFGVFVFRSITTKDGFAFGG